MTGFLLQRYVFYFVLCCDRRTEWGGEACYTRNDLQFRRNKRQNTHVQPVRAYPPMSETC